MGSTGQRIDGVSTSLFGVEIGNVVLAEFTEASGLEAEIEVFEYEEGGNNLYTYKLPGRVKFPNVTLKRGITESNDLWDWFQSVMYRKAGNTGGNSSSIERKEVSIVLYDHTGSSPVRRWNLTKAYPIKWTGPSFNADENAISVETLVLAHEGMIPE